MLAIIIPFYKLTFFKDTLESLKNQTDKRFKVYIGDDASPEDCTVLLEKYKGQFNFVYKRFENNLGLTSLTQHWERCIELSEYEEWLMVLGDDDVLSDNVVKEFYTNINEIAKLKINVIRFATVIINKNTERISDMYIHPKLEDSVAFLMRISLGVTRSSLSEYIFRKKVLKNVKFHNLALAWHSDHLAVFECSIYGYIFSINEALVFFRQSGINISSRKDNVDIKYVAEFKYYHYLLIMKSDFFNTKEKEVLLCRLEKIILNNKKKIHLLLPFTRFYIANNYYKRYFMILIKMTKLGFRSINFVI